MEIVINYSPREQFRGFHDREDRWAAIVAHRRAGKTVACIHDLNRAALTMQGGRFAYVAPFYAQAKDIAWGYLKEAAAPVPGVKFNESELRVDYPNGARVRLYGADNFDRMRGIFLDGVVLDEFGDMDPRAWSEVIRPALADRKGWAVFIGTPKGQNAFYDICERAKSETGWFYLCLKASETGLLDAAELADASRDMTDDQYAQEFECSFEAAVPGAYYAKLLAQAETDKRICAVPHDPALKTYTFWDLGKTDSTPIWFVQFAGGQCRFIDFYQNSGEELDHYARVVTGQEPGHEHRRKYLFDAHHLPHDARAKILGMKRTREEQLRELLPGKVLTGEQLDIMDGINSGRVLLSKCWFDAERCKEGLKALRHYRNEWDDKRKVFKNHPLHDWSSHAADAFREFAVNYRDKFGVTQKPRDYKFKNTRDKGSWATW